jgi:hypothetical protein
MKLHPFYRMAIEGMDRLNQNVKTFRRNFAGFIISTGVSKSL